MSTYEYNDLYLKCQNNGQYHVFVFDIKDSKKMNIQTRNAAQNKMIKLMINIYKTIEKIEKSTNRKILVFEEDFVAFKSYTSYKGFGVKQEPFLYADTFGFTVYRDSIDKEIIYFIYENYKKLLEIDFDFHIADGYYQTNKYELGGSLYFRGYCIDLLSTIHKKETIEELNKIKKKIKL